MKCRYCQKESSSEFCSKEHKKRFYDRIEDALIQNCPPIVSKGLTPEQVQMQQEFLSRRGA